MTSQRDKDRGAFLQAQSISQAVGLKLEPGDIIYLRRWSAGVAKPLEADRLNRTTPSVFIDRIPLRYVVQEAQLYDYEREFLINTLSLNRSGEFKSPGATDGLPEALLKHEVALWNALVDNLWVKRLGSDLFLTVSLPAVVSRIPARYQKLFIAQDNDVDRSGREVAGIETPLASPYCSVSEAPTTNSAYFKSSDGGSQALVNFISVQLGGLDMSEPGEQERDWTLEDWENSGVCQAQASTGYAPGKIRSIWLKDYAGPVGVVSFGATRTVVLDLAGRSRQLIRQGNSSWVRSSIERKDLGLLTLRDVQDIEWSVNGSGVDRYRVVPNCRIRQRGLS